MQPTLRETHRHAFLDSKTNSTPRIRCVRRPNQETMTARKRALDNGIILVRVGISSSDGSPAYKWSRRGADTYAVNFERKPELCPMDFGFRSEECFRGRISAKLDPDSPPDSVEGSPIRGWVYRGDNAEKPV